MAERLMALLSIQPITLSLSLLQRMACNNDGNHMLLEEAESLTARKRLWASNDDGGDDDSSDSPEEETKEEPEADEEVSLEETFTNQLNTSEEKLFGRRARGMLFGDDGDTPSTSSEPHTPRMSPALRR
jgi:hypothetical protein